MTTRESSSVGNGGSAATARSAAADWTVHCLFLTCGVVAAIVGTTLLRYRRRRDGPSPLSTAGTESSAPVPPLRSALYAGRVWHTRFRPVRHSFHYPLFIFCLDLDEVEGDGNVLADHLIWSLSWICQFRTADHLKNGEGKGEEEDGKSNGGQQTLRDRVLTLVRQKCGQDFSCNDDETKAIRVLLVTHLRYFGYCFNPVSFYVIQDKLTDRIQAVVGEVSNTPWNEMHCYVLHADSTDHVRVATQVDDRSTTTTTTTTRYIFPKQFHVSPFMEMNYLYDWTFRDIITNDNNSSIVITNTLRAKRNNGDDDDADDDDHPGDNGSSTVQFHAKMDVTKRSLHPWCIAYYMATYPCYCAILQVWIHYQAAWLFLKGVPYQPHPHGAETTASRIIGTIMTPLFAAQVLCWRWWGKKTGR
jgi:uncharacterized protein